MNFEELPQIPISQNDRGRSLKWGCFGSCAGSVGDPIDKLCRMVISRSESAYRYFLALHSRLVSVALIFLGSAGPGLP